jgi:hypothetical protein
VYLLTDVWRIHFENDVRLQEYFRRLEGAHCAPPLVAPDEPALILERVETLETRAEVKRARTDWRRALESELARGRAVFHLPGRCHLCGATLFLVRSAGPATLGLEARLEAECTCTRCGLDGTARGAFHALDLLGTPHDQEGSLLIASDSRTRRLFAERFPRATVVASATDVRVGARFQNAVCVNPGPDGAAPDPFGEAVIAGGMVVLASGATDAGKAGVGGGTLYSYWSREYGYLGREYFLYAARIVRQ